MARRLRLGEYSLRGKKIQAELDRLQLSQTELASRIGMPQQTLNRIMTGQIHDPGVETMARIARELGQPLDYFQDDIAIGLSMASELRAWLQMGIRIMRKYNAWP